MIEDKDIDLFKRYKMRQLGESELSDFEIRLQNDNEFSTQYQTFLMSELLIKEAIRDQLKMEADVLLSKDSKKSFFKPKYVLGLLFVLCFLVMSAYFLIYKKSNLKPEELYAYYYEKDLIGVNRSTLSSELTLAKSIDFYNSEKYDNALELQDSLAVKYVSNGNVPPSMFYYLSGLTQLEIGQQTKAVENLEKVNYESTFYKDAQWYLALALLNSNRIEESRKVLVKIIDRNDSRAELAQKILTQLP